MTFAQAAKQLNIPTFPEEMDEIYEELQRKGEMPFTRQMLAELQAKYNLFEDYYDAVLEGFDDLARDEARRVWSYTVAAFAKTHTRAELCALKLPETDLTPAGQMAPLFPLVCLAERSYFEYLHRGFSEEEARFYLRTYRRSMGVSTRKTGKPGLQKNYFNWSSLYAYTSIFNIGGFNFQIGNVANSTYVIMNRKTREIRVLLHGVMLHASGMILGSAGFEEEAGSYWVDFEETEAAYVGYPAMSFLCPNEKQSFSKEEWELVLSPGDAIFCLHIPKGADLSPKKVAEAIVLARGVADKSFPEYDIKGVRCISWLLCPKLNQLLGAQSNISNFSNLFSRYPVCSNGDSVFSFAFEGKPEDLNTLPEKTSLQRKLKELYLGGDYIHNYGGFILD